MVSLFTARYNKEMARLATRFKNQEVVIKETSSESPWIGTVRRVYKEAEQVFYEVECEGEMIALAASSVEWIQARKNVKVIELNKINFAPLRLLKSSHN